MGDETPILPDLGEGIDGNVNVPDTTGGEQVPDTVPEPVPMPEPEDKDAEDRPMPGPIIGPVGF